MYRLYRPLSGWISIFLMIPQGSDESRMIENAISMRKFESDEVCEQIILLKLSSSGFGEFCYFCFYCFGGSILKYFDIIVINKFTFPYFCVFCSSLCLWLNNTVIFNFETKSFCQKRTKVNPFNSMNLDLLKDVIDCDLFSSDFHEGWKVIVWLGGWFVLFIRKFDWDETISLLDD
jgi:hypothetical protein